MIATWSIQSNAQGILYGKHSGPYTYIYQLSVEQALKILKNDFKYQVDLFQKQKPVDSFPSDSNYLKTLPYGEYVFVTPEFNYIGVEFNPVHSFTENVTDNGSQVIVFVNDLKTGLPVDTAEVSIGGKRLTFNRETAAYHLENKPKKANLIIRVGGQVSVISLRNYGLFGNRIKMWKNDYYSPGKYNGFIAFSKPRYQPGDTIKLKAWLCKKNGKPLTAKVRLYMSYDDYLYSYENRYLKRKPVAILKPVSPGAYIFEKVVTDSLKMNSTVRFTFRTAKKEKFILSEKNYLEDYQLREVTYIASPSRPDYYKNDTITILLYGTDANNQPILDGSASVKILAGEADNFTGDSIFIPDILWESKINLNPDGETKVFVPGSVLPEADMKISANINFTNSNNEIADTTVSFNYNGLPEFLTTRIDGDELVAEYFSHSVLTRKKGKVIRQYEDFGTWEKEIEFPYREKIDGKVERIIFCTDRLSTNYYSDYGNQVILCEASKMNDSVRFELVNPYSLDIYYTIFRGKNEVKAQGKSKQLKWSGIDKSETPWFLECRYYWYGQLRKKTFVSENPPVNLHLTADLPENIYPGQKVKVQVQVNDPDNKPLPGANITAGSVNAQFRETNVPDVPFLIKPSSNRYYEPYSVYRKNPYGAHILIKPVMLREWGLDTISYYRFLFPENGIFISYERLKTDNAQFAPFIMNKGKKQPVYMILADDNLLYYYDSDANNSYSFIIKPGKHKITVRTRKKEFTFFIESLNGYKTIVSIDENNPPDHVKVIKTGKRLSRSAKSLINYRTLKVESGRGNSFGIRQGGKFYIISRHYYSSKICPVEIDSLVLDIHGNFSTVFDFEPCYTYSFYPGTIKMVSHPCRNRNIPKLPRAISFRQDLYDLALTGNDYSNWIKGSEYDYNNYNTSYEKKLISHPGTGSLKLVMTQDSQLSSIAVTQSRIPTESEISNGNTKNFYLLKPGYYRIILVTKNNCSFVLDSVLIREGGQTLLKLDQSEFAFSFNDSLKKGVSLQKLYASHHYRNTGKFSIPMTLGGTVKLNYYGSPVRGVAVKLYKNDSLLNYSLSNEQGWYSLRVPVPGLYKLKVSYPGIKSEEIDDICLTRASNLKEISYDVSRNESDGLYFYHYRYKFYPRLPVNTRYKMYYRGPSWNPSWSGLYCPSDLGSGGFEDREVNVAYSAPSIKFYSVAVKDVSAGAVMNAFRGNVSYLHEYQYSIKGQRSSAYKYSARFDGDEDPLFNTDYYYSEQNRARTSFSDIGFWVPNLVTDKNGQASFEVTFPDNLTMWKSYIAAMDDKKHSALVMNEIKSTKKLFAGLSFPRFMTEGDEAFLVGKIFNYSGSPVKITRSIITPEYRTSADTTVDRAIIEKIMLKAFEPDTLQVSYSLQTAAGFKDGEQRDIVVYPAGLEESKGYFCYLDNDTSTTLRLPKDGRTWQLYAQNNTLDFMLDELDKVDKYPYYCMEQAASKLKCLLMEKNISRITGKNFGGNRKIRKMISILENGQKEDGSWGWWNNSPSSFWITAYVTQALQTATKMGFYIRSADYGVNYFKNKLDVLDSADLLTAVEIIAGDDEEYPLSRSIEKLRKYHFNYYQKLQFLRILQVKGLDYDIKMVTETFKKSMFGNYYWGENNDSWYDDRNTVGMTILAYKLISGFDSNSSLLPKIANYFMEYKSSGGWQNTIESASILETILPLMLKNNQGKLKDNSLEFKGALQVKTKEFPFTASLQNQDTVLNIKKTGSNPVYMAVYSREFIKNPKADSVKFSVRTYFEAEKIAVSNLKAGQKTELVTKIKASCRSNYVMITIPIPAGCSYSLDKSQENSFESHREYYRDKVVIFCETLPEGEHTFRINLEPRFNGSYTLNPAKAELMYFPVFKGNNTLKTVKITD